MRAVVALKDTQKNVNGWQEKWAAEEKRSAKRKSRHLNVLVVILNGKKKILLCNSKLMTTNYISALIVAPGSRQGA